MSDITEAEKRGYSKGYAAGRKRTEKEERDARLAHERNYIACTGFRAQVFCSALQAAMTKGGWTMDGKAVTDIDGYVELASRIAYRAAMKMTT